MLDYPDPVSKLLALGDCCEMVVWPDYLALGLGPAHIPDLIRMALDEDLHWADSEGLAVWSPVHAWRALAQLHAAAAVEPLVQLLTRKDAFDDDWISEDLPRAFGVLGPAAIPALRDLLTDLDRGLWVRVAAVTSLEEIGQQHGGARDECVATLTGQLEHFAAQDPTLNGFLVNSLIDLKAVESASVMERAFTARRVDLSILGDWEEAQIMLGLLRERQTPRPDRWGDLLELGHSLIVLDEEPRAQQREATQSRAAARRTRQKQQKQSRQKSRRQRRKR